jgi:hypothetical protein
MAMSAKLATNCTVLISAWKRLITTFPRTAHRRREVVAFGYGTSPKAHLSIVGLQLVSNSPAKGIETSKGTTSGCYRSAFVRLHFAHTSESKDKYMSDLSPDAETNARGPSHWIPVIVALVLAVSALSAAVVMTILLPAEPAVFTTASAIAASGLTAAASVALPRR